LIATWGLIPFFIRAAKMVLLSFGREKLEDVDTGREVDA